MDIIKAHKLVEELLATTWTVNGREFNLNRTTWRFGGFTRAIRALGTCKCSQRRIVLSRKLTALRTVEEVEQTIIHEIAHAIDFEIRFTSKHDYIWLNIARQIGYKGRTTTKVDSSVTMQTKKYIAICETHGILGGFTRKVNNNKICSKCKKSILILPKDDARVLEWVNKE